MTRAEVRLETHPGVALAGALDPPEPAAPASLSAAYGAADDADASLRSAAGARRAATRPVRLSERRAQHRVLPANERSVFSCLFARLGHA